MEIKNIEIDKLRKSTGITLIALVITIIVLLILAGVSIAMLTGNNGILTQAKNAKQATEDAAENEETTLAQVEANTHLENYEYIDKEGNKAIIPAGFAVSNKESEKLISKGLVIIGTNGNEYVWVPCTEETYARETSAWWIENDPKDNPTLATKDELTLGNVTPSSGEDKNGITTTVLQEIVEQVTNEKISVRNNGGYYIGRYEVGKEDEKAVVKPNRNPYTNLIWSDAYKNAKSINVGNGASSYLCSSYAWDTAIKFIETHSEATNYGDTRENLNENWSDKEVRDKNGKIIKEADESKKLQTGLTSQKANIYDMGGNVKEFTTELNPNTSEAVILRGGFYDKSNMAAGPRVDTSLASNQSQFGFRSTLFVK